MMKFYFVGCIVADDDTGVGADDDQQVKYNLMWTNYKTTVIELKT